MSEEGEDLGQRATRSTFWALLGYGGSQGMRFIGNLVLTRLLFEEAFGMMALVNVLLQGLALFSDIGTRPSIVQNERGDDPLFLNTAWTLQVLRGFTLWAVACAIAYPAAEFYGEPLLLWLLPVSGIGAALSGFNSTKYFTVGRHLNLKRLTLVNVFGHGSGVVVMIVWGVLSPTIWALVAGGLVSPLVKMVLTHLALPGQTNRFAWDGSAARALLSFGRWIFLSTILTFATSHADRLIFGKLVPLDLLGIYSIGSLLATMPAWAVGHVASSVTFPLYSRARDAGAMTRAFVARVRFPFLLLGGWAISGLLGGGQVAIDLFYDDRYAEAGWIVQLISVMGWLVILEDSNRSALLAKGRSIWLPAAGTSKLVGMIIFIPLGFQQAGFKGAVAGFVLAEGLKCLMTMLATHLENIGGRRAEIGMTAVGAVASLVGWLSAGQVATMAEQAGWLGPEATVASWLVVSLQAVAVFVSASAVWALIAVPYYRKVKREGNPLRVEVEG